MVAGLTLGSCDGVQSALDPAGEEAQQVATLFWAMAGGGCVIWLFVVALALYAARWKARPISAGAAGRLIFWGGVAFPVAVLAMLLSYALWLMPSLRPFASDSQPALTVEVVGHQYWWQVQYHRADGQTVVSANEVRLPVGRRVEFRLSSADMIHSFWIPVLAGKMDLIPGRTNRLSVLATKVGTYRGQCAEFCGVSHALMTFPTVVMEQAEFEAWLDERGGASRGLSVAEGARAIFDRAGCGACHDVDGSGARSDKGPDLSHIGSRLTIAAGVLDNDADSIARFISDAASVKPGAQMPRYSHLSAVELEQLATWLKSLR